MSYQIFQLPRQFILDSGAALLPGFQVTFYLTATSTLRDVYTDSSLAVAHPNPVVADANGLLPVIYLDSSVTYRATVTDQYGVLQYTVDPANDNAISGTIIGLALYPRTAGEIAAGVTPTDYTYPPFDIRRYGGDSTGGAASDAALTKAISVCGITGGTIRFPTGTYKFDSQVSLNQKRSIIFEGDGGSTNGSAPATAIIYTGTGTPFIDMTSAWGCELRKLQVKFNNSGFTGVLLRCGDDGTHGNSFMCGTFDCTFGNDISAFCVHINLDKNLLWTSERCFFFGASASIEGQASAGGSYSNVATFRDCEWQACNGAPCRYGGENWSFSHCTWEALTTGVASAFTTTATAPVIGLTFDSCWFGDVTVAGGTWITAWGRGVNIKNCRFGGEGSATDAIELNTVTGCVVQGNDFDTFAGVLNFADANSAGVLFHGNNLATVTAAFVNPDNAPANLIFNPNSPMVVPGTGATFGKIATPGFDVSPSGVIRQWGQSTVTKGTPLAVTFPITFPTAVWGVSANINTPANAGDLAYTTTVATTGVTLNVAGGAGTSTVYWEAVGN